MNDQIIRIPAKKWVGYMGIIICLLVGLLIIYLSLTGELSGSNPQIRTRTLEGNGYIEIINLLLNFLPKKIMGFIFFVLGLFLIWVTYWLIQKVFSMRNDVVIISPQGIIVRYTAINTGVVFWCDIKDVTLLEIERVKFVGINLFHPERYEFYQNQNKLVRAMNSKYSHITIPSTVVKLEIIELYSLIRDHHHQYKG